MVVTTHDGVVAFGISITARRRNSIAAHSMGCGKHAPPHGKTDC